MRNFFILICCLALLIIPQKSLNATNPSVLWLNNQPFLEGASLVTEKGRLWLAARDFADARSWQIHWHAKTATASLQDHDGHVYTIATKNTVENQLQGKIINKRLFIPARAWAETLQWEVQWTRHGTFFTEHITTEKSNGFITPQGEILLGMPTTEVHNILGEAQEMYQEKQQTWWFYLNRYEPSHFSIVGFKDDKINYLATMNDTWQTEAGWSPLMHTYTGPTSFIKADASLLVEKNKKLVHTILLTDHFSRWETGESYERALYHLINAYRGQHYFIGMADDDNLKKIAAKHNQDMIQHDFLSHTSFDGSHLMDRLQFYPHPWSFGAENIAYGKNNPCTNVNAWINSNTGHRETLLGDYRSVGISAMEHHQQALVTANFIR